MSNIGKKPVEITEGVSVTIENNKVIVSGSKGTLETIMPIGVSITLEDGKVKVKKEKDNKELEKFYGLARSLISNMVEGVSKGFEKRLELVGVGYRAKTEGDTLILNVGFANTVKIKAPEGISIKVEENKIVVSGIDKELVGNIASKIRGVRVPDPYKGKGIKYIDEKIRRKVGKAAKAVGGK